jgi:hypothetical protein
MFSRKRPRHVRSGDAPPSEALAQSLIADDEAPAPERGPYDARHAPEGVQRLDLGSLQIPALEGVEVRVQASPEGVIEHVVLVSGSSGVELGAFAAPRTDGVWAEVRDEMARNMAAENLAAHEVDGPYGPELLARLPDPEGNLVDVRFVGVDGPRWFVKATFQGPVAADPASAPVLRECLEGLVVVRDDEPRPVRETLPLRLPAEMAQQVPPDQRT